MLSHLLDTCIYSQLIKPKPHPGVAACWKGLGDQALAISSITEGEVVYGLAKKNSPNLWQECHAILEGKLKILPADVGVTKLYGELRAQTEREGVTIGGFDLLIACTALVHDLILVTANVQDFAPVPGLQIENWTEM